jgi:hypothetical protein
MDVGFPAEARLRRFVVQPRPAVQGEAELNFTKLRYITLHWSYLIIS